MDQKHPMNRSFEDLFIKYYPPFCIYARRYIGDMDICKNIVSDVFVIVWNKRYELNLESKTIVAYLKLMVKNSCLNHIKHSKYERKYVEVLMSSEPSYSQSPETIYTLNELYEILDKTIDSLPTKYKDIFIKSFIEEKKQNKIAQELSISTKSVHRYTQKLFAFLRSKLSDFKTIIF